MKKYVKYLIITLVVGIMIAIGTYAYWSYESSNKKNISIQTSRELSNYIIYDEGESKFAGELKIGSSYLDGVHTTISIKKTNDASNLELIATVNMTVNAIGDNIKNSYGLKWAITKGDSTSAGTLLNQGNFYGKNNDDVIELKTGIEVTTTEEKYTVWIWIDGSENIDPKIVGETLDTSVWTQVDQILDNRFEVTSINSNYQFINASAVNTTKNIVAYAVTNTSSQPSSYTNLTTQEQGNVYNVVDYKVTNTGTYYVWFKDSAGNTVNKSVAVSKIDTTPPVCTFGNFEPSTIKNGETSVVELTCVDEEIGIKSSDITSSSITLNGSSATLNSNIEKTRITNGFKYKLTVTGTSTDGDTSLSLNTGVVNNKAGLSNSAPSSTPTVKVQNITNVAIPIQSGTLTYNSTSQTVTWSNYDSSKMTVSGTTSATNAGTYSATFTLKDTTKYRWPDGTSTAKTVSWKINQYNISNVDVGSISDQTYTGSAITPVPVLSKILNGSSKYTLVKDTDYTLSYSNNTNVGTATITATGKGNFTGTASTTFKINKASLTVPSQSGTLTYNTASQSPSWSNYDSTKMTVSGTTSATNAGTYSATFTLKSTTNYKWSDGTTTAKTVSWKINQYNISNVDVEPISDQVYTESAITPVPVLSKILNGSSEYTLVKDTDYTLSYSNNTNVGTATITATGKGNFTGTKIITFKIVQIKVYQNIFDDFRDYSVSGNNSTILYDAGKNEYTFNNTSTSDPYAEISQKAYLTANTTYTVHADFKTTGGTKITGSSEIFQIFYRTQSGGYSEDKSFRLSPSSNTVTFKPTSTGYYYFRFDNDYGNSMIVYNFSIGFTKDITYGKTYGNLTSGSQIVGSNTELFAGWYTETSYTNKVTSTTTVTNINSHVLFAKWKLYGKFNYWNGSSIASTYSTCELTSGSTCTLSVPSAVSGSTAKNAAAYVNVSTGTSSMSAGSLTISDNSKVYYAYYRKGITNHYYTGSTNSNNYNGTAWSTRTLYKNVFFTSDSALSYVISTSQTGTTNLSHGTGMGSAAFKGFSINGSNFNFSSIAKAAESTTAYDTLYSVYNIWYNSNNSGYYNSLSAAVSIASSGSTLTLNTSYLEDYKKIVISKKITLKINKTVEFSSNLADIPITLGNSSGTVEAGDLYLSGSGTLKSNNKRTIYNYGGVLQCESVKFTGSAIHISSTSGTVKLGTDSGTNGCSITKTSTTNNNSAIAIAGGTAYMYAGTIDSAGYGIYVQDAGTVNVYGGSITSTDSAIYSAAGSSGYIRIGRAFSDNKTLNSNGIANTAKNRYSGLGKKSNYTNPKIIVDGTGNPAINIYSTSSSANNAYLRINHGYIEAKSTVVSISSNAKNVVYIDGGALYSSNSHVYHNQSTSVVTAFTGSAHLYSVGYSTVNSVNTIRINTSLNDVYNGIEESRSDCSDSDDSGLGRYYGTYIMSQKASAIYASNDSAIGVSIGDSTYTQGSKTCDKFRNEGATLASYKAAFVGKISLYWYAGSAYHNSAGSTYYAGDNVTKETADTTRLHSKNNAITATTISFSFNDTTRGVSVDRRSYPYQTELTKAFGSEVTTVTRTSGTLYAWRSGSSCTSFSGCGSGSCNSIGVIKSEWNIYVISQHSSYSNLYYAWVPITSSAWSDKYPGYHILAKDGHAAISTCAGLEYPVTFSKYVTTTYNNRTYAKVKIPLKNGSTCYVSDCSNLPS